MSNITTEENFNNYKIIDTNQIGSGGFGKIYKCIDTKNSKKAIYAIKLETMSPLVKKSNLEIESKILTYLKGGIGIPKPIEFFTYKKYNCLVMECLGENLQKIFIRNKKVFSLQKIKNISLQILSRIEFLHFKNLVHCDIKPENFTLGLEKNKNTIYLIDYGISKKYISSSTKQHIKMEKVTDRPRGTIRYCSINSHMGYTLSRRDDLISFVYMIIYFFNGSLPWDKKFNEEDVSEMKMFIDDHELCFGLPKNIYKMWVYVKNLNFEQMPDYKFLKNMLKGLTKDDSSNLDL